MLRRRAIVNQFIRTRNIKIAFMVQSVVTTVAVLFMMVQTSNLDQASRWEMDLTEERCRGCCVLHNDSLNSIANEPYLSEKLHKFSRAVQKYNIPDEILNILHEAEHKIEEFEKELQAFKHEQDGRISQLQETLIEEDVKEKELVPKAKPKWRKPPAKITTKSVPNPTKPTTRVTAKTTAKKANR